MAGGEFCGNAARAFGMLMAQRLGGLPQGLVEEIRALSQPPIPWDVKLARWFDERFEPLEKRRTYARLSRRQTATPDIPRPSWRVEEAARAGRSLGISMPSREPLPLRRTRISELL